MDNVAGSRWRPLLLLLVLLLAVGLVDAQEAPEVEEEEEAEGSGIVVYPMLESNVEPQPPGMLGFLLNYNMIGLKNLHAVYLLVFMLCCGSEFLRIRLICRTRILSLAINFYTGQKIVIKM